MTSHIVRGHQKETKMLASWAVPHKPKTDQPGNGQVKETMIAHRSLRKEGPAGAGNVKGAANSTHHLANAVGDADGGQGGAGSPKAAPSTATTESLRVPPTPTIRLSTIGGETFDKNDMGPRQEPSTTSSSSPKTRSARVAAHLVPAASMSGTLRREKEVMDPSLYHQLCYERLIRRQDPSKGVDKARQSYVYYNHRSKGCYIPHEKDPSELTLTYNHMYDFGDGSRFLAADGEPPRVNPNIGSVLDCNYNAASKSGASRDYARLRPSTTSERRAANEVCRIGLSTTNGKRTVAVDLARSLQLSDIRPQPFQIRKTVEDVISSDLRCVERAREGISSVVGKGKVLWAEVPEKLQATFSEVQGRFISPGAESRREDRNAAAGYRAGSTTLAQNANAVSYLPASSLPDRAEGATLPTHAPRSTNSKCGQSPMSKPVALTDLPDHVLLGFTANVCMPKINQRDGEATLPHTPLREESTESEDGNNLRGTYESTLQGTDPTGLRGTTNRRSNTVPEHARANGGEKLLPLVALAQLRDADYFLTTGPKPVSEIVKLLGPKWLPERPLPYETSRLSYCRKYDMGDANPPPNMIHWTLSKKLY